MTHHSRLFGSLIAAPAAFGLLLLAVPAPAGTTGGLSGTVTEGGTTVPVADARVSVTSPSQTASTVTDSGGHFHFVSLAPDEYVATVEKSGYDPASYPGIAVFADAQ
ncbi:MAG TPA: carboxypeptidase-like regulatory domain-containing protein, partial [Candidatus Tumulicola sp.]